MDGARPFPRSQCQRLAPADVTAHLEVLGRWVAGLRLADVPPRTLRAARAQVLDMAAAARSSARGGEVRCVLDGAAAFASPGRATALATGARLGPADAAAANAACSMAQDFDDIVWMGHTCHSAVFASLAVAQHEGKTSAELLTAVVAANEVAGRLGASSFLGPLNGQMWTFVHLVGAAAATAKLLGLDGERTAHALAISLAQPTFALQPGFLRPSSKLLAAATPTATGLQAAYFARAGMTGALELLEDPRGFWRRFSFLPMPFMLGGLGRAWVLDTLTVKTFPGCHYFQTALTALERLSRRDGPLTPERVRAVRVETTKLACEATRFAREAAAFPSPRPRGEGQGEGLGEDVHPVRALSPASAMTPVTVSFDLAQSAAVLLVAGRLGPEELNQRWLDEHREALRGWLQRLEVTHDPALTAKVLAGARALAAGDEALKALSARALLKLRRRYAEEYQSSLLGWGDLLAGVRGALKRDAPEETGGDGVPLYFPARVTVRLADGREVSERVDLPAGSLASPRFEQELKAKVLRELPRAAWDAGLALESQDLGDLITAFCAPPG